MKKTLCLLAAVSLLCGCQKNKQEQTIEPKQVDTFTGYQVDTFYDVEILRYKVPGFEDLSLKQKMLIYCLSEASLYGRDILFDQNGKYNLSIRRAMEHVYTQYPNKDEDEFRLLELYLKRVWFSNGIYHHYSNEKFCPEFSEQWLRQALAKTQATEMLSEDMIRLMFADPKSSAPRCTRAAGIDIVKGSAGNYYEGVTQAEALAYYKQHEDRSECPKWIGLNSKLVKENGVLQERVFHVGGMYGEALLEVNKWLGEALKYVENDGQRAVIEHLIAFNETGDLETFNAYCIAWVKELEARVDFVNGFTEVYTDPLGITGAWEAMVNYKDLEATKRTEVISANAQWFEDHSTTDPRFKKEECKGVSAKVITAAMLGGDCYPATPIGINLPNAGWIRQNYGSKSVTIDNLMSAYTEAAKGNGFDEEFIIDAPTRERANQYYGMCNNLHTDLHECVGHGSGKLLPGVSQDALGELHSTIEETRADLFGLYFMGDAKMVELGLLPNMEAYKAFYYQQMMNGLMTQLVRIEPGNDVIEAHMQNRQLIARWVLAHAANNEVEIVEQEGKHYVRINDYEGLRRLYGELLAEIQRVTSEGDYPAALALVNEYAIKVDPVLHKEILSRYEKLQIRPYKGFVNPVYTLLKDANGQVTDVTIRYDEDYVSQHLRYSHDYSPLPSIN